MANSLNDGLSKPNQLDADAVETAEVEDGAISTAKLAANAVTSAKAAIVGTGSPTGYGQVVQHGAVTATDVAVWTAFPTAFAAAPTVVVTLAESGAAASHPGCVTTSAAGSFGFLGTSGLAYSYYAAGSGSL